MKNKKGELFTLGIVVLAILSVGIAYFEGKVQNQEYAGYVGDSSTNYFYYGNSSDSKCNFNEIIIDTNNIRFFKSSDEAMSKGFKPNPACKLT